MSSNDLSRMLADLEVPGNVASEVAVVCWEGYLD